MKPSGRTGSVVLVWRMEEADLELVPGGCGRAGWRGRRTGHPGSGRVRRTRRPHEERQAGHARGRIERRRDTENSRVTRAAMSRYMGCCYLTVSTCRGRSSPSSPRSSLAERDHDSQLRVEEWLITIRLPVSSPCAGKSAWSARPRRRTPGRPFPDVVAGPPQHDGLHGVRPGAPRRRSSPGGGREKGPPRRWSSGSTPSIECPSRTEPAGLMPPGSRGRPATRVAELEAVVERALAQPAAEDLRHARGLARSPRVARDHGAPRRRGCPSCSGAARAPLTRVVPASSSFTTSSSQERKPFSSGFSRPLVDSWTSGRKHPRPRVGGDDVAGRLRASRHVAPPLRADHVLERDQHLLAQTRSPCAHGPAPWRDRGHHSCCMIGRSGLGNLAGRREQSEPRIACMVLDLLDGGPRPPDLLCRNRGADEGREDGPPTTSTGERNDIAIHPFEQVLQPSGQNLQPRPRACRGGRVRRGGRSRSPISQRRAGPGSVPGATTRLPVRSGPGTSPVGARRARRARRQGLLEGGERAAAQRGLVAELERVLQPPSEPTAAGSPPPGLRAGRVQHQTRPAARRRRSPPAGAGGARDSVEPRRRGGRTRRACGGGCRAPAGASISCPGRNTVVPEPRRQLTRPAGTGRRAVSSSALSSPVPAREPWQREPRPRRDARSARCAGPPRSAGSRSSAGRPEASGQGRVQRAHGTRVGARAVPRARRAARARRALEPALRAPETPRRGQLRPQNRDESRASTAAGARAQARRRKVVHALGREGSSWAARARSTSSSSKRPSGWRTRAASGISRSRSRSKSRSSARAMSRGMRSKRGCVREWAPRDAARASARIPAEDLVRRPAGGGGAGSSVAARAFTCGSSLTWRFTCAWACARSSAVPSGNVPTGSPPQRGRAAREACSSRSTKRGSSRSEGRRHEHRGREAVRAGSARPRASSCGVVEGQQHGPRRRRRPPRGSRARAIETTR